MKLLALLPLCLIGLTTAQQAKVCKPSIEADTPGLEYEKLVDRFIEVKRQLDQIEKTENAIGDVEQIIMDHANDGLDAIMVEVRKLGLELVPKPTN